MHYLYELEISIDDLQVLTNNFTDTDVCNHLSEKIRSLKLRKYVAVFL